MFISSTTLDLEAYREAACEVISDLTLKNPEYPLVPMSMDSELLDGERMTPVAVSKKWVDECDWMILIVGWYAGWSEPGSNCPVTEWEYRQACLRMEERKSDPCNPELVGPKKLFVFLAGDIGNRKWGYRAAPDDPHDLKDHFNTGGPGFDKFREELKSHQRFKFFRNMAHFKDQLRETLLRQIVRMVAATHGQVLAQLGVKKRVDRCVSLVKKLANRKRVHEALHDMRQRGLKKLHSDVLTQHPKGGQEATSAAEAWKLVRELFAGARQTIKMAEWMVRQDLPLYVGKPHDALVKYELSQSMPNLEKDREAAVEAVDEFARLAENSFTFANRQMVDTAKELDAAFIDLCKTARRNEALIAGNVAALLNEQLERANKLHNRLQHALKTHDHWQKWHNNFEALEAETSRFDKVALNKIGQRLHDLQPPKISSSHPGRPESELDTLIDGAQRLFKEEDKSEWPLNWDTSCRKLRESLEAFDAEPSKDNYGHVRNWFDQLFVDVDAETLGAVDRTEGRVDAFDEGLNGIDTFFGRFDS